MRVGKKHGHREELGMGVRKNAESKEDERGSSLWDQIILKKRENNLRKIYKAVTTKFVPRHTIKMKTKTGEEHSDSILTFKFNYDVLFLTTKMLQILLVLVWSESWTLSWSEESFRVAVKLAVPDVTWSTWSPGHLAKAGLWDTTRHLEKERHTTL